MQVLTVGEIERTTERIPLLTSSKVIESFGGTITPAAKAKLLELIDTETDLVAVDVAEQYRREHAEAVAKESEIAQQLAENETRCQEAQAELKAAYATPGSLVRSVIYWICAACAGVCEFYITNVTLPMALDVERTSPLGIALSLGPAVAFVFVEKPLEYLHKSTWHKAYAAFLWLVFAAHLLTVDWLAIARHEIAHVVQQLAQGLAGVTFDDTALSRAITAISLILVIDGALFLLCALQEGRLWRQLRQFRARVRQMEARRTALHAQKVQHAAVLEVSKARLSDNRPNLIAQHFKQHCLVALDRLKVVEPTSTQRVEDTLGLAWHMPTTALN